MSDIVEASKLTLICEPEKLAWMLVPDQLERGPLLSEKSHLPTNLILGVALNGCAALGVPIVIGAPLPEAKGFPGVPAPAAGLGLFTEMPELPPQF